MNELEQRGRAIANAMGKYRGYEPLIEAVSRMAGQLENAHRELDSLHSKKPCTWCAVKSFVRRLYKGKA